MNYQDFYDRASADLFSLDSCLALTRILSLGHTQLLVLAWKHQDVLSLHSFSQAVPIVYCSRYLLLCYKLCQHLVVVLGVGRA